ncbi:MAG: hypothetical protein IAG13_37215, partial [Deltaproteobacteria bacterium]|nr:hypothetical protein [Nannocystaceae bacterium]
PPASVVAMAAMVLGEQAQAVVEDHAAWVEWLEHGASEPPAAYLATTAAERECIAVVRELVDASVCPALGRVDPTIHAIIVALLHACGLRTAATMVAAMVTARLPTVVAEADRHRRAQLHSYPMQLPPFDYEEEP